MPILAGRFWAYVGTIGGVIVSAAANFGETATNDAVPGAMKFPAALLMALLPVGLFVALEVLVRNRIKEHLWWWRGGMLITAFAFAIPSYSHMHDLLVDWGQNSAISYVTPFGWDGLMLLSTLALLLDPRKASETTRFEHIIAIPAAPPPSVRTIALEPVTVPQPRPVAAARKAKQAATKRFARPEDHPLFAAWRREGWSDDELARHSGKTVGAARAQAGRWRKYLAEQPPVSDHQLELIKA